MFRGQTTLPILSCALTILGMNAIFALGAENSVKEKTAATDSKPIAVVELFTSEKCPSCPPADEYLSELAASALRNGEQVFPLAFHVDYYPSRGETDPLSSRLFLERQQDYVESMGLDGPYTPQMIVNGTQEFIGSHRLTGDSKIRAALSRAARVNVKVAAKPDSKSANHPINVEYEVASFPTDSVINIAFVEKHRPSKIDSHGQVREYANVVRVFKTVALKSGKQKIQLSPPASASRNKCAVVAYVQNPHTHAILGAASTDLPAAPTGQASLDESDRDALDVSN